MLYILINMASNMHLNDTDRQLIALLRDNARTPVTELAATLRVSRATVQKHINKLEQAGIIVGYTVRLKPEAEAQRIRAWMSVAVEGPLQQEHHEEAEQHPAHRGLEIAAHLQPGVGQQVQQADAEEPAPGEREQHLRLPMREREEGDRRTAREGGGRDQHEIGHERRGGRGIRGGEEGRHGRGFRL